MPKVGYLVAITISFLFVGVHLRTGRFSRSLASWTVVRTASTTVLHDSGTTMSMTETTNISSFFSTTPVHKVGEEPAELLPPLPLRILLEYQAQHSHARLVQEFYGQQSLNNNHTGNRTYAVAFYSCPWQAGNRLHHFFNSVLWAVVTNRTVLWKYYDADTCRRVSRGLFDPGICRQQQQQQKANNCTALQRASWIPALDDWIQPIRNRHKNHHNGSLTLVPLSYWSTNPKPADADANANTTSSVNHNKSKIPVWQAGDERHAGMDAAAHFYYQYKMVDFYPAVGQRPALILNRPTDRDYLLHTEAARQRAAGLLSKGVHFLYGMLFRQLFALDPTVLPSGAPTEQQQQDDSATSTTTNSSKNRNRNDLSHYFPLYNSNTTMATFSIALHSRHSNKYDNGSNVSAGIQCLDHLLRPYYFPDTEGNNSNSNNSYDRCVVFLMSDRPATLARLDAYVRNNGRTCTSTKAESSSCCIPIIAHHEYGTPLRKEHGVYAGNDFFRDLALASQARHGFAGSLQRSSSQLLRELIEYDRQMEAWELQESSSNNNNKPLVLQALPECNIPKSRGGSSGGQQPPPSRHS